MMRRPGKWYYPEDDGMPLEGCLVLMVFTAPGTELMLKGYCNECFSILCPDGSSANLSPEYSLGAWKFVNVRDEIDFGR